MVCSKIIQQSGIVFFDLSSHKERGYQFASQMIESVQICRAAKVSRNDLILNGLSPLNFIACFRPLSDPSVYRTVTLTRLIICDTSQKYPACSMSSRTRTFEYMFFAASRAALPAPSCKLLSLAEVTRVLNPRKLRGSTMAL